MAKSVPAAVSYEIRESVLDRHAEASFQAACADVLVVAKTEVAGGDAVARLKSRLHDLNPLAAVHESAFGELPAEVR